MKLKDPESQQTEFEALLEGDGAFYDDAFGIIAKTANSIAIEAEKAMAAGERLEDCMERCFNGVIQESQLFRCKVSQRELPSPDQLEHYMSLSTPMLVFKSMVGGLLMLYWEHGERYRRFSNSKSLPFLRSRPAGEPEPVIVNSLKS